MHAVQYDTQTGIRKGIWTPNQRQKAQRYVQHEDRN